MTCGCTIATLGRWLVTPPVLYVVIALVVLLLGFVLFAAFYEGSSKVNWRRIAIISTALTFSIVLLWFGIPTLFGTVMPTFLAVWEWWNSYGVPFLAQVVAFITTLVTFLLGFVVGLGAVALLGNQLIDQFKSPVRAGQSVGELFDTSFALGATLAIVLLVCYANADYRNLVNEGWSRTTPFLQSTDIVNGAHWLVPSSTRGFLAEVLSGSSLPIFDLACAVAALFLASCSLLMGSIAGLVPHTWRQVFAYKRGLSPILTTIGGALVAIVVGAIDAASDRG